MTKKLITITDEALRIAKEDSVKVLGKQNVSGYITYLLTKSRKK